MARVFGVTVTGGTACGGIFNDYTKSTSVDIAEARDESGKMIARQAYSKKTSISVKGVTDGTVPEAGTTVVIGATTIGITGTSEHQSNTAFGDFSVDGDVIDGVTLTPYSAE